MAVANDFFPATGVACRRRPPTMMACAWPPSD